MRPKDGFELLTHPEKVKKNLGERKCEFLFYSSFYKRHHLSEYKICSQNHFYLRVVLCLILFVTNGRKLFLCNTLYSQLLQTIHKHLLEDLMQKGALKSLDPFKRP